MTDSLVGQGLPARRRDARRPTIAQRTAPMSTRSRAFIRLDFAYATRSVLMAMAGIMAVAAVVAIVGLKRGVQEEENLTPEDVDAQATAGTEPA